MVKKIAFVHDWLVYIGGADKLFFELIKNEKEKNPGLKGKIFALVSKSNSININGKEYEVITALPRLINDFFIYCSTQVDKKRSKITKIFLAIFNYRNLIVFYPILMKILSRKIKKFNPEKAIISSANISKNINYPKNTYTKLYLHSPLMYIQPEFKESSKHFNPATRLLLKIITPRLRYRDKKFNSFSEVRCNSFHTASLTKKIYKINAKVAYPKIPEKEKYLKTKVSKEIGNYYIYVGRLVTSLRHVDKMIKLFNKTGDRLIVIGDGPDGGMLRKMAKKNIEFKGHVNNRDYLIQQVVNAKGYINLAYESSGMSTAEALTLGVPVFGYNKGGTAELVSKNSGHLIGSLDLKSTTNGFELFKKTKFDRNKIKKTITKKIEKNNREKMLNL